MSRRALLVAGCAVLLGAHPSSACAQHIAVETLASLEFWKTDDSSRLLARNDGRAAMQGNLYVWLTARFMPQLELRGIGYLQAGNAETEHTDADLDMLSLRYTPSRAFNVEGGRILYPIGSFGYRRFANVNPLIGVPDLYPGQYPAGVVASGAVGVVDYRLGAVDAPLVNLKYTPAPGHKLRPVVGAGWLVGPWLHLGVGATKGPYLNSNLDAQLPAGAAWDSYNQTIVSSDAHFSMSHSDAHMEIAWSSYDVPTAANPVHGVGWYTEFRQTLSPRVFVAARYENYLYPFVLPVSPEFWVGVATRQMNGEAGIGYRFSADALAKLSLRRDHWPVHAANGVNFPDGYALAAQFSLHTDVVALVEGKQ